MKTTKELQKEIMEVETTAANLNKVDKNYKKEYKKLQTRVVFLRTCLRYLEADARSAFVEREKERVERRIDLIMGDYSKWENCNKPELDRTKKIAFYKREMGVTQLEKQLKTIQFLLGNGKSRSIRA